MPPEKFNEIDIINFQTERLPDVKRKSEDAFIRMSASTMCI